MSLKRLTIMYDPRKHNCDQVVNKVIEPILREIEGLYDNFDEYGPRKVTPDLDGFFVFLEKATPPKIQAFSRAHNLDLERMARNSYFLRSLRKR